MKIGLFSDIHGNLPALRTVLSHLKDCDQLICAGDVTGVGPYPNEVIDIMMKTPNIHTVLGNHDQFLLDDTAEYPNDIVEKSVHFTRKALLPESFRYLSQLQSYLQLNIEKLDFLLVHACPWNPLHEYVYPDYSYFDRYLNIDADVIVQGHTHVAFSKKVGEKMIINPGSCGLARDIRGKVSCALLDTALMDVQFFHLDYPYQEILEKLDEMKWPHEFAHFIQPTIGKN